MKMLRAIVRQLAVLIVALPIYFVGVHAATVEERLDQINQLPEKSRSESLEKEARKEGEVVWYAAMASDRAGELIKVFENKYPFLKVRFQPGGASRQLEQLLVEHGASRKKTSRRHYQYPPFLCRCNGEKRRDRALSHAAQKRVARRLYR